MTHGFRIIFSLSRSTSPFDGQIVDITQFKWAELYKSDVKKAVGEHQLIELDDGKILTGNPYINI